MAIGDYLEKQKENYKKELDPKDFGPYEYIKQSSSKYKFGDEDIEILTKFRKWTDLYLRTVLFYDLSQLTVPLPQAVGANPNVSNVN